MSDLYEQLEPFKTVSYKINGECLIGTFLGSKIDISNGQKMALIAAKENQTIAIPLESINYQVVFPSASIGLLKPKYANRLFTSNQL